MQQFAMYINGASVNGYKSLEVINPATGSAFAQVQCGNSDDVDRAVAAARAAFPAWAATPWAERKAAVQKLAGLLEANMAELMELVTLETGKPLGGLAQIGSGMELGGAIGWTQYTAELELPVEVAQDDDQALIEIHRKPLGVVGSITPWNWPLMIAIWHVIPALLTGNTVVIKPSPFTPTSTLRFVELAGSVLPAGVMNAVVGEGDVGAAMVDHPDINKIVFTGSTPTGKKIMAGAASNLKRITLELGGNDAGIIMPGTDIEKIADEIFAACFHNNGQTCAALKRLYVHASQYEQMGQLLAERAKAVVVGDGLDQATQLGPIQNAAQLRIVEELADSARADGGRFLAGGQRIAGDGYFFAPTIVADLSDGSRLVDEEPFGPIVPLIKYDDIEDVLRRANANDRGLGGSVWDDDVAAAAALAMRLESGTAWVNTHGSIQPNAPFGGVKQSGVGVEFGAHGLAEYTSIQTLKIAR